jgi:hypothetical protein
LFSSCIALNILTYAKRNNIFISIFEPTLHNEMSLEKFILEQSNN